MRWQELFADLEAQAASIEKLELDAEVADRTRAELAKVPLLGRLHAQLGSPLRLRVYGVGALRGRLDRIGADWLLLTAPDETLVPLGAIASVADLPLHATTTDGLDVVASRLPLRAVVRAIARDRTPVTVRMRDGAAYTGTAERVGADFVDLGLHEIDQPPRRELVQHRMTVPFDALSLVSRQSPGWD